MTSPAARRLNAALDAASAAPELPAAPAPVAVPAPVPLLMAPSPTTPADVPAPTAAAPQLQPAEPPAAAGTEVLGAELGSAPVSEALPLERTSRASAIGRYALPIGIAVGLAFAVTGVGAVGRVKERWRDR